MKKSHVIRLKTLISAVRGAADTFYEDRVTVYAAQASFFVVISAVPFLSLLIAAVSLIRPTDLTTLTESVQGLIPAPILSAFSELLTELR